MTLTRNEKITLSNIRMEKSREFLEDARANFKEKRYRTSVNRTYYAVLNAIRAILILQGANLETHEGVITILSLKFIKTGLLPVNVVKGFKTLLTRRTDVDYGDFDDVNNEDAEDSIKIAEEIINIVDKKRKAMIGK